VQKAVKMKQKAGFLERFDKQERTIMICKDMFKADTDMSLFTKLKVVHEQSGTEGIIEGLYGQEGKFKVRFPHEVKVKVDDKYELNIAGLVPGEEHGAPFDARALSWKEGAPLEWLFECKARSGEYSAVAARDDLEKKIKEEEEKQKAISHAMLIAVRGEGNTKCYVWYDNDLLEHDPPNDITNAGAADDNKNPISESQAYQQEKENKLRILLLIRG